MKIIVAADKNWGIGKDNKLLVSIPADMKMFRQETTGKVCVMGRKTLESFPGGLPLKNRINIVLTRNENYKVKDAIIVHSIEELMEEVRDHDPRLALDGHEDGLYFYRKIVSEGRAFLKENGWMLFEIGYDQGEAVKALMQENGFFDVQIVKDLTGLDRVVLGRR
mgnify:FL=1